LKRASSGSCVFSRCLKLTPSSCGSRAVATVPGSIISKLGCGKPGCCAAAGMLTAHSATLMPNQEHVEPFLTLFAFPAPDPNSNPTETRPPIDAGVFGFCGRDVRMLRSSIRRIASSIGMCTVPAFLSTHP
jgi:hypothetical protein